MTIHFHPEPHTSPPKVHYFRQDIVPGTGDGLVVGDLWSDTTAGLLKRCTSISPVTFVSTEGGSSAHDLGSATHSDVNDAAAPTKGSLLVGNGTNWVEVGVGTNGEQLEADSAQASGVKWAAAGGASEFGDDVFRVTDDVDATKKIAFQASGITTGNVRTLTVPDKSFTIADNADLHNEDHASRHPTGGADEIDGDKLDIDWNPTNYNPTTSPTEADDVDNLTAHLAAIDNNLEHSKSITVEDPTSSEDISIFFTNKAITITEIRAVLVGSSTPSVTWTIRHGTDRNATGAEAVTGGTTTTSVTTGSDVTTFNDATIIADSFVWLETTAKSGTVDELHITIVYTVD